jgi:acetoin utilization deacetylase AcuC-like enzyme
MVQCLIDISAGFDNHAADWGGLLNTEDYEEIGRNTN